jgi:hypothetical protein
MTIAQDIADGIVRDALQRLAWEAVARGHPEVISADTEVTIDGRTYGVVLDRERIALKNSHLSGGESDIVQNYSLYRDIEPVLGQVANRIESLSRASFMSRENLDELESLVLNLGDRTCLCMAQAKGEPSNDLITSINTEALGIRELLSAIQKTRQFLTTGRTERLYCHQMEVVRLTEALRALPINRTFIPGANHINQLIPDSRTYHSHCGIDHQLFSFRGGENVQKTINSALRSIGTVAARNQGLACTVTRTLEYGPVQMVVECPVKEQSTSVIITIPNVGNVLRRIHTESLEKTELVFPNVRLFSRYCLRQPLSRSGDVFLNLERGFHWSTYSSTFFGTSKGIAETFTMLAYIGGLKEVADASDHSQVLDCARRGFERVARDLAETVKAVSSEVKDRAAEWRRNPTQSHKASSEELRWTAAERVFQKLLADIKDTVEEARKSYCRDDLDSVSFTWEDKEFTIELKRYSPCEMVWADGNSPARIPRSGWVNTYARQGDLGSLMARLCLRIEDFTAAATEALQQALEKERQATQEALATLRADFPEETQASLETDKEQPVATSTPTSLQAS